MHKVCVARKGSMEATSGILGGSVQMPGRHQARDTVKLLKHRGLNLRRSSRDGPVSDICYKTRELRRRIESGCFTVVADAKRVRVRTNQLYWDWRSPSQSPIHDELHRTSICNPCQMMPSTRSNPRPGCGGVREGWLLLRSSNREFDESVLNVERESREGIPPFLVDDLRRVRWVDGHVDPGFNGHRSRDRKCRMMRDINVVYRTVQAQRLALTESCSHDDTKGSNKPERHDSSSFPHVELSARRNETPCSHQNYPTRLQQTQPTWRCLPCLPDGRNKSGAHLRFAKDSRCGAQPFQVP